MNQIKECAMLLMVLVLLAGASSCSAEKQTAVAPPATKRPATEFSKEATPSAEEVLWLTDFAAAQKLSAETGRPILADFSGSDWCGWCIKLDKEVFSKSAFQAYAKDNLILFLADFPSRKKLPEATKKQNEALSEKYGIRGFPTVLLLDAKGKVLAKTGYQRGGPEAYVAHLKELTGENKHESTGEEAGS